MLNLLFTYGTLLSEFTNDAAINLHRNAKLLGQARCKGEIYLLKKQYPGAVLGQANESWIDGEVWELKSPSSTLTLLDAYEECSALDPQPHDYKRTKIEIVLKNQLQLVWIYEYVGEYELHNKIQSGNFKKL
jgi:gamma-glutamylcyclotransferase (GGCT)/AIG2-like uncharacterized protein YtfP